MGLPLRPLEIKQLFDFAIRIYRANFVPIVLMTALVRAPVTAIGTVLVYHIVNLGNAFQAAAQKATSTPGGAPAFPDFGNILGNDWQKWVLLLTIFGVFWLVQLLAQPWVQVAICRLTAASLTGEECSLREALDYAAAQYWPTQIALFTFVLPLLILIGLTLLPAAVISLSNGDSTAIGAALAGSAGFVLLGAAATSLLTYRFLPALCGALQASEQPPFHLRSAGAHGVWLLKRSWALTATSYWRVFGLMLMVFIAVGFIQNGISKSVNLIVWLLWLPTHMPSGSGSEHVMSIIQSSNNATVMAWSLAITSLFMLLTPGLILCYQNLLYFDLRFRKEGFDLDLLLDRAGQRLPAEPVSTVPLGNIGI